MNIFIGNDHGGYRLKCFLTEKLRREGHTVTDCGGHSEEICRYPYFAAMVASAVSRGEADRGILICSTGIGMSMAANKYPGVRAALVDSVLLAQRTRLHNDANILCLGGLIVDNRLASDILDTFLTTEFEGGRHCISLGLIEELEKQNLSGGCWNPGDRESASDETGR